MAVAGSKLILRILAILREMYGVIGPNQVEWLKDMLIQTTQNASKSKRKEGEYYGNT